MSGEWKVLRKIQDLQPGETTSATVDDALFSGGGVQYIYIVQAPDGSVHKVRAHTDEEARDKISSGEFEDEIS